MASSEIKRTSLTPAVSPRDATASRAWFGPDRGRHRPHPDRTPVAVLLAAHRPASAVEATLAFGEMDGDPR